MAAPTVHPAAPGPTRPRRVWTLAEVQALTGPDHRGTKYELIGGELLVTPAPFPPHARMVMALTVLLLPYVGAHKLGELFSVEADISLEPESLVQPDLLVIPPDQRLSERWESVKRLLLAVEVISESSRRTDRVRKRLYYQRNGVGEYWIVDLDARAFEVWGPRDDRAAVLHDRLVWRPRLGDWVPDAPPLEIDLVALFDRVLGPEPEATP